jgi:hypothetical protein
MARAKFDARITPWPGGETDNWRQPGPIGYLNTLSRDRERTIGVDADRALLVQWAFQTCGTGNYSLNVQQTAIERTTGETTDSFIWPQVRTSNIRCPWLEDVQTSSKALKALIFLASAGFPGSGDVAHTAPIEDVRGPVAPTVGKLQTSVTPEMVERMAGSTVVVFPRARWLAKMRLHRGTVTRHLGRLDGVLRRQGLGAGGALEAVQLYASGMTLAEAGVALDVAAGTVRKQLLAAGVSLRPAGKSPRA